MGTYYRSFVDIQADENTLKEILKESRNIDKDWVEFCFRKTSGDSKWEPSTLVEKLSKKYPNVIFYVKLISEYGSCEDYYLNGDSIPKEYVFKIPRFPTLPKLQKSIIANKKAQDKRKAQQLKQEELRQKELKKKQIADLKAKLEILEKDK